MIAQNYHKINLGLQITKKLPSGYHDIKTVLYPCSNFKDTIEIVPASQFSFTLNNADFTCDVEQNLCVKAYRFMQNIYDLPPVAITLTKQIPSGAGLGGGSANAALTLKMLNAVFSLKLNIIQQYELAVQLGSDTAFFIFNTPMFATGRGELLEPAEIDLDKYRIEVVCPNISISTAEAYSKASPQRPKVYLKKIIKSPIEKWKKYLTNDFEEVIFKQYPQLLEIKNDFYSRGALYASMSGSGSAVYGIFA